ncbi:MAG: hypothetical protein E7256_04230 [Lachnospiraceae bacterium]|nr:hypothetical protein [Lachnospiraceae bacterium]
MSEEDKELERIIKESLNDELACENITVSEELIQRTLAKAEAERRSAKERRAEMGSEEAGDSPELDRKGRIVSKEEHAVKKEQKREEKKSRGKNVMPKIIRMAAGMAAACLVVMVGMQMMRNGAKNRADSSQMESAEFMDEGMGNESFTMGAPFEGSSEKETASSGSLDAANDQMADIQSDATTGPESEKDTIADKEPLEEEAQSSISSGEEAAESENYNVSGDTKEGKETIARILLMLTKDQVTLASSDAVGTVEMNVYMAQSEEEAVELCITSDGMLMVRAYEDGETKSEVTYELSDTEQFKEQIRDILK